MTTIIEVNNLSKKFSRNYKNSIKYAASDLVLKRASFGEPKALRESEFWALKDVSFALKKGEVLGVLGHNGAGKSTMLKCIAGKLSPDAGKVVCRGELGYIIEMSSGFSPTLTGKENIRLRGKLLGKRGKELERFLDQVADFADIGEFIDSPIQFYSSGMKARLGFAASVAVEPDILIIDEVLAVGDLGFRLKCYERVNQLSKKAAVLFVSHSIGQVARLCTHGLYLEKGREIYFGDVQEAISRYQDGVSLKSSQKSEQTLNPEMLSFQLIVDNELYGDSEKVSYGSELKIAIDIKGIPAGAQVRILLRDASKSILMDWNSIRASLGTFHGFGKLIAKLGKAEFSPGSYSFRVQVMSLDGKEHLCLSEAVYFNMGGEVYFSNPIQRNAEWEYEHQTELSAV